MKISLCLCLIFISFFASSQSSFERRTVRGLTISLPQMSGFTLVDTFRSSALKTVNLYSIATFMKGENFQSTLHIFGIETVTEKKLMLKDFNDIKMKLIKRINEKPILEGKALQKLDSTKFKKIVKGYYLTDTMRIDTVLRAVSHFNEFEFTSTKPQVIYNTTYGYLILTNVNMKTNDYDSKIVQISGHVLLGWHMYQLTGSLYIDDKTEGNILAVESFVANLIIINNKIK